MKKLFFIFAVLFVLMQIGLCSATLSFSNYAELTKSPTEKYGTIDVFDGNWVLPDEKVVSYTLLDNSEQCLVDCYASGNVTLLKDMSLFDSIKFNNGVVESQKIILVNGESYEADVPDYITECKNVTIKADGKNITKDYEEEQCNQVEIGKHKETFYKDKEYKGEVLTAGTYKWKIEVTRKAKLGSNNIDWIAKSNNVDLSQWAWWNSSWSYKKQITGDDLLAQEISRTNEPYQLWINGTHINSSFCQDVRIVDSTEAIQIPTQLLANSSTQGCLMQIPINYTAGSALTLYAYYGNPTASLPAVGTMEVATGKTNNGYMNVTIKTTQPVGSLIGMTLLSAPTNNYVNPTGATDYSQVDNSFLNENIPWNTLYNNSLIWKFNATSAINLKANKTIEVFSNFPCIRITIDNTAGATAWATLLGNNAATTTGGNISNVFANYTTSSWAEVAMSEGWYVQGYSFGGKYGIFNITKSAKIRMYGAAGNANANVWGGESEKELATTEIPFIAWACIDSRLNYDKFQNMSRALQNPISFTYGAEESGTVPGTISISVNITTINNTLVGNAGTYTQSTANATNGNLTNVTIWMYDASYNYLNKCTTAYTETYNSTNGGCGNWNEGTNYYNHQWCAVNSTATVCSFAPKNFTIRVDTITPVIAWTLPTTIYTNSNNSCGFNFTITDANIDVSWMKIYNTTGYYSSSILVNTTYNNNKNSSMALNFTNLPDNVYIVEGYANDTLNRVASLIIPNMGLCFLDTLMPQTNISGSNGTQTNKNITVNVLTNDYGSRMGVVTNLSLYNSAHVLINNTINSTTASTSLGYIFYNLADGLYYYNATATDIGGNINYTETLNVTIDTTLPSVSITVPLAQNYTTAQTEIDYTISDTNIDSCTVGKGVYGIIFFTTNCAETVNDTALTSHEGSNTWYAWANDTAGNQKSASVTFFVDTIPPSVVYTSNSIADGSTVQLPFVLEGYATDTNYMKNTSLMFGSSILNSGACPTANSCTNIQYVLPGIDKDDGYYEYNFTFCDVYGLCNTTTTRNVTISTVDYNATTIETSTESFVWHYFDSAPVFSLIGSFVYNNTAYPIVYNCSNYNLFNITNITQCDITSSFDIPLISSAGPEINSFYFNVTIFNGYVSYNENSAVKNQSVDKLAATYCTNGTVALNFTVWDEQNQSKIEPFKFEGTINYYLGTGGAYRTLELNIIDPATTKVDVCINQNTTYYIDAIIAYSAPASGLAYPTRNWFYQRHPMSNVTEHIPMYLLQGAASTQFILQVQDKNLLPVKGVLVEVQKCYVGNNTTPIAFISRTDANGLTTGNFEVYNALYQFRITNYSNTLLYVTPCSKVIPQTAPYTLLFQLGTGYISPFTDITNATAITSSLSFNKSSGITTFSYTDTSGQFNASELVITSMNYSGNLQPVMCDVYDTNLSSGILSCNLTKAGTYNAIAYIYRGGEILYDQIVFTVETFSSTVGYYGVFIAFFLLLVSAFAFKFNEIAGIWLMVIGCVFCNVVGLIAFGPVAITAIICIAITITVVLER